MKLIVTLKISGLTLDKVSIRVIGFDLVNSWVIFYKYWKTTYEDGSFCYHMRTFSRIMILANLYLPKKYNQKRMII